MRARRPAGVNTAGAVRMAGGVPLRLASFIRHCAYAFGEPVIATAISSQAISRSICKRRSIHQTAGCHPAMMRTTICRMLTRSSRRCTCAHSWISTRSSSSASSVLHERRRDGDHRRPPARAPQRSSPNRTGRAWRAAPSRRTRRQCGRTDSACDGNARLRARARRMRDDRRDEPDDLDAGPERPRGKRSRASTSTRPRATRQSPRPALRETHRVNAGVDLEEWQCGQGDHEKRGGPAHRVSHVGRCAFQREQHQPQCRRHNATLPQPVQHSVHRHAPRHARSASCRCSRSAGSSSSSSSTFSTSRLGDPSNRRLTRWRSARRRA